MRILLISGHGAGDPGACGNGYKEANLTREITKMLAEKLRKYCTVDIYNTSRNAFYDVQNGTFRIGKYDYVLEIHLNAFNKKAYGSECYVTSREAGITVEQEIMKRMKKYFALRDNDSIFDGVKRTNFLVINTVKSMGMSGALLETCFIDNKNDMKIYQKNKDAICEDIAEGIAEGFGLKKTSTSTTNKPNTTTTKPASKKSVTEIAKEVIAGKWGNGADRINRLTKAGYNASEVQAKVNELCGVKKTNKKSNEQIANEVIQGKWDNGIVRKQRLTQAGYDYNAIQAIVNKKLK